MSEFPKKILALAALSLIPLLLAPLFLFGAQPFGTAESKFGAFLLYLATHLLWVLPIASFFVGLDSTAGVSSASALPCSCAAPPLRLRAACCWVATDIFPLYSQE